MPDLSLSQWLLAIVAAMGIGIGKSGFAGVSLVHVLIFAFLFGARNSTGVVLPLLIVGDICALIAFHQHARWDYVRRMLPPACTGVVIGWLLMHRLDEAIFKPLIGFVILALTALQVARMRKPEWFTDMPHARWFAWTMGLLAGITTMLANAAGPIMALYFLAVALPKFEFVGTSAWYFFIVNSFKVPFSISLGLIHGDTLLLNAVLIPAVATGMIIGRWLVKRIPQRLFDGLLLGFAALAALKLIGVFSVFASSAVR
jgi:uncharacterized membrane protein YfcA